MCIDRIITVPMVDDEHVPISLKPAGINNLSSGYGMNRFSSVGLDMNTAPEPFYVQPAIGIRAESGNNLPHFLFIYQDRMGL